MPGTDLCAEHLEVSGTDQVFALLYKESIYV